MPTRRRGTRVAGNDEAASTCSSLESGCSSKHQLIMIVGLKDTWQHLCVASVREEVPPEP